MQKHDPQKFAKLVVPPAFAAAGFTLNKGTNAVPQRPHCPVCGSINTQFLKGVKKWQCNSTKGVRLPMGAYKPKCGHQFEVIKD